MSMPGSIESCHNPEELTELMARQGPLGSLVEYTAEGRACTLRMCTMQKLIPPQSESYEAGAGI